MLVAQEIYGPHDGGLWSDGPLAMGRRLFRILPEDVYDRQPLQSRDSRLALVADVRLDNRDELIGALALPIGEASQLCDAAILLESLERWGERALDRLVGDFAFALWDARAQRLLLVRDFLGKRPLHYHCSRGFFAFTSMPKGLHALTEVPYAPDEQMIAEFVALMPQSGPRSFFKDINRVETGSILTVTREGISTRRYWEPHRQSSPKASTVDYVEGLRHHFDQAVRSRLRGVNSAAASTLSAGVDSSSVTATAARLLAPTGGKVVAFTAVPREGYDNPAPRNRFGDEGPLAAATAAIYQNLEHVLVRTAHRSPIGDLDRIFFLFDRPMLNLCNSVWMFAINHAARERKLNVMLTGVMGNMTISYNGLELLPELLRAGRLFRLWREATQLVAKTRMRWRGAFTKAAGPFMPVPLWQWVNETFSDHKSDVLNYTALRADCLATLGLPALARERQLDLSYRPWKDGFAMRLWVMRRSDPGNGAKGTLAGWGIDQRDPTADKRLVEYCLSVPMEQYLAHGVQRALARQAFADRLPEAVLSEQRKGYQAIDWHEGLTAARTDVAAELARIATCTPAMRLLDIGRLGRLVANWPTEGWERQGVGESYRLALLRGISAGHFLRKALGTNR